MIHDAAALYTAYASRDPRFDGVFYIGRWTAHYIAVRALG